MTKFAHLRWFVFIAVALVSAAPLTRPDELLRRGNAAFRQDEHEAAVELYTRAEEWVTDPGLVAFNKAAALYRLGRFREAELHYRRCREDAAGARRAKLHYDLANCLVQRAGEHDAEALAEAIHLYDECRRDPNADASLTDDAQHNIEIAKLLRLRALTNKDNPDAKKTTEDADTSKSSEPRDKTGAESGDPAHFYTL